MAHRMVFFLFCLLIAGGLRLSSYAFSHELHHQTLLNDLCPLSDPQCAAIQNINIPTELCSEEPGRPHCRERNRFLRSLTRRIRSRAPRSRDSCPVISIRQRTLRQASQLLRRRVNAHQRPELPMGAEFIKCQTSMRRGFWAEGLEGKFSSNTQFQFQGHPAQNQDCLTYQRSLEDPFRFELIRSCDNNPSYRQGGNSADMSLFRLSHDIWISSFWLPTTGNYQYDLLLLR